MYLFILKNKAKYCGIEKFEESKLDKDKKHPVFRTYSFKLQLKIK